MRMRKLVMAVGVVALLSVGGCAEFSKENQGMVLGGVLGGLGGSMIGSGNGRIIGTIAGVFAGGYLGRTVGRYMDAQDKMLHERALENTVIYGSTNTWENSQTGHRGRVDAGRTYSSAQSKYCREYTETIIIDGRPVSAHGTACRERDGSWRITNQ